MVITTRGAEGRRCAEDRLELELVADAGHFVVDESPSSWQIGY